MKSDFLGWTRRRDRFHPDCSEQLRANPPPRGPVGSRCEICEMSREGTHSNQGFHECHTYSLTSFSQPVRFTHSELDLEVPIQDAWHLWLKEQRSPSPGSSQCLREVGQETLPQVVTSLCQLVGQAKWQGGHKGFEVN